MNPDFVGRTYRAAGTYQVGREKVREFAAGIGDANPVSTDVDAARALGYSDIVAPPTFAIVLSMAAAGDVIHDPDLGLDYTRVVHGEQKFSYARPIVAGDELVTVTTIEAIRSIAGNDMVTTRADISTVAGEHVVTATTLLISRGPEEEQ